MGFKKDEIELVLRANNLNLDEAIEILNQSRSANSIDAWRRHDEHNAGAGNFDHNNFPQRYPGGPQQAMPFQVNFTFPSRDSCENRAPSVFPFNYNVNAFI